MKDFINEVITLLQEEVGEGFRIRACDAKKNNGIILHGITICNANDHTAIAPAIYLDGYYQEYITGQRNLKAIVAQVLATNKECMANTKSIKMDFLLDFAKVRDGIMYKLINFEKNQDLLQEIPYVKYLDMAVVFFYDVPDFPEEGSTSTILIRNNLAEHWGVSTDDLYNAALKNTPEKYPAHVDDMENVIRIMTRMGIDEDGTEEIDETCDEDFLHNIIPGSDIPVLYILSNHKKLLGAACLLYPDLLERIREKLGTDMYILPSSIHEVLVLPVSDSATPEQLKSMVETVNMKEVSVEDFLSNNVYIYSNGELAII